MRLKILSFVFISMLLMPFISIAGVIFTTGFETSDIDTATRNQIIWEIGDDPYDSYCAGCTNTCTDYSSIKFGWRRNLSYSSHPSIGSVYMPFHRAHSGSYSFMSNWKQEDENGSMQVYFKDNQILSDNWCLTTWTNGFSEFYWRQYFYFTGQDGTFEHPAGGKYMRMRSNSGSSGAGKIEMIFAIKDDGTDSGPTDGKGTGWRFVSNSPDLNLTNPLINQAVAEYGSFSPALPDNTWICVELHIKLNTYSGDTPNNDGFFEVWVHKDNGNGTFTQLSYGRQSNQSFGVTSSSPYKFNQFQIGGWFTNHKVHSDQYNYAYIDDVVISTDRIGTGSVSVPPDPPSNSPPTATITSADSVVSADSYSLTATCSDTDGTITDGYWSLTDSTPDTGDNAASCTGCTTASASFTATVTGLSDGTNTVYFGCRDNDSSWDYDTATVTYSQPGTDVYVSVSSEDSEATEAGPTTATARIARNTSSGNLPVSITVGGTATSGVDYTALNSSYTIPDGSTYVDVTITPIDDYNGNEPDTETVTISVVAGTGYSATGTGVAYFIITDNDEYSFGSGEIWGEHPDSDHAGTMEATYINKGVPNSNFIGANELRLYTYPAATNANTALIKWDLTAADGRPVEAATIYIYNTGYDGTETNPYYASVHKIVNVNPTLSAATWNCARDDNNDGSCDTSWTAAGALSDIAAAEDTVAISTTPQQYYSFNVTSMVDGWVSGASNNYGMALTSDNSGHTQLANEDRVFANVLPQDTAPVLVIKFADATSGEAGTSPPGGTGRISIGGEGRMNPK